eukprot:TCONS_00015251-protein
MVLHHLDIRTKHLLKILHETQVVILEFAISHHRNCQNKVDLKIGFQEVITANFQQFKNRKFLKEHHHNKHFYDAQNNLKHSIDYKQLDILLLTKVFNLKFISKSLRQLFQCCGNCENEHQNCICNIPKGDCVGKINCGYKKCSQYPYKCDYTALLWLVDIAESLRNCIKHLSENKTCFNDLENGTHVLQAFPQTQKWDDLWAFVKERTIECLQCLKRNAFLDDEKFDKMKMELEMTFRADVKTLVPIDHYHTVIMGGEDAVTWRKQCDNDLKQLNATCDGGFKYLRKQNNDGFKELNKNREKDFQKWSKDFVYLDGIYVQFEDANHEEDRFVLSRNVSSGCTLLYKDTYQIVTLQCRGGHVNVWNEISPRSKVEKEKGCIEVTNLFGGDIVEFRALAKSNDGTIVIVRSDQIEIKEFPLKDLIEIDGRNKFIGDLKNSSLDIKTTKNNQLEFILPTKDDVNYVLRADTWDEAQNRWICREHQLETLNGREQVLILNHLQERCRYDVRVLAKNSADEIIVLTMENITTKDAIHRHTNTYGVTMVSHTFGLQTDAPKFIKDQPNNAKDILIHTGACKEIRSFDLIDCGKHVRSNFSEKGLVKTQVLIPQLHQLHPKSLNFRLAKKILEIFGDCYLLTNVDFHKHLSKTLGYDDQQMSNMYNSLPKGGSAMVLYPKEMPIAIIITLPENENESLHQLFVKANENLKAFMTIHADMFKQRKQRFVVINTIAAAWYKRKDFENYCTQCNVDLMLFKEELETNSNFEDFYRNVKKEAQDPNFDADAGSSDDEANENEKEKQKEDATNMVFEIASRSIVMESIIDERFPNLFCKTDEKICKRILNEYQSNAILDLSSKKIITGPYGSGKSVVIHETIQRLATNDNDIIYYIGFDEYTIQQVQMHEFCWRISPLIRCRNIADLSIETSNATKLLTLSQCLSYIENEHLNTIDKVHIIIDEFDGEDVDEEEARNIKGMLESPFFKKTNLVIAIQSCQKSRRLDQGGRVENISSNCLQELGIKEYKLPKTMRYSGKINDVMLSVLSKVEEEENFYNAPDGKSLDETALSQETPKEERVEADINMSEPQENIPSKKEEPLETFFFKDDFNIKLEFEHKVSETNLGDDEKLMLQNDTATTSENEVKSMVQPILKFDDYFINLDLDSDNKIISSFKYPENKGNGTGVKGVNPSLLRLDSDTLIDVKPLVYYLRNVCFKEDKAKHLMIVCNFADRIPLIRCALASIDVNHVEYIDCIHKNPAKPTEFKRYILDEWKQGCQVLLTDCRGCRGTEYKEVLVIWDESDYHSRHMFGEALSRARTNLYIVTIKSDDGPSCNLTRVVDTLIKQNLVQDKTKECFEKSVGLNILPLEGFKTRKDFSNLFGKQLDELDDLMISTFLRSKVQLWHDPVKESISESQSADEENQGYTKKSTINSHSLGNNVFSGGVGKHRGDLIRAESLILTSVFLLGL